MSAHQFSIATRTWTPEVILALAAGPKRFNWLLGGITGISDRVLTERLRELESSHLVVRHVDGGPPVRVTYRLTWLGESFIEPLRQLAKVEEAVRHAPLQEAAVG